MKSWILILAGAALVSWGLFTPELSRNARAAGSLLGGVLIVVGLAPDRTQRAHPTHEDPED